MASLRRRTSGTGGWPIGDQLPVRVVQAYRKVPFDCLYSLSNVAFDLPTGIAAFSEDEGMGSVAFQAREQGNKDCSWKMCKWISRR